MRLTVPQWMGEVYDAPIAQPVKMQQKCWNGQQHYPTYKNNGM